MGDTTEQLPIKASMFLNLSGQILSLADGIDSNDPIHEMIMKKAEDCFDQCISIIVDYKDDSDV